MGFRGENFVDCLLIPTLSTEPSNNGLLAFATYCPSSLQTITGKTFANRHKKKKKFTKVFSLESFPLYNDSSHV